MTVAELAALLATYPPDAVVIQASEGGHLMPALEPPRLAKVVPIPGGLHGSTEYVEVTKDGRWGDGPPVVAAVMIE